MRSRQETLKYFQLQSCQGRGEQLICLEVKEACIKASAKGQNLNRGDALRCEMGVEVLQDLPEGEDSRKVSCRTGNSNRSRPPGVERIVSRSIAVI